MAAPTKPKLISSAKKTRCQRITTKKRRNYLRRFCFGGGVTDHGDVDGAAARLATRLAVAGAGLAPVFTLPLRTTAPGLSAADPLPVRGVRSARSARRATAASVLLCANCERLVGTVAKHVTSSRS